MTDLQEKAMRMALKLLEHLNKGSSFPVIKGEFNLEVKALRQALAHPEQEPVVEFMGRRLTPEKTRECWGILLCDSMLDPPKHTKLYTAPPKREWQGLTDEEYDELMLSGDWGGSLIQATEAKLKEKNI